MSVYKKFEGEYAAVNLDLKNGSPKPTLLGFGIISSSVFEGLPEPNWIWRLVNEVNLVENRLCTFFNLKRYETSVLFPEVLGSFILLFRIESYTIS